MEVYLVRHTTPNVEKGVCYGQSNLDLVDTFDTEANELIKSLPKHFDAVYSSPLTRCSELAKRIVDEPIFDNRLMELNFGDWELKKWDEIPENQLNPWMSDYVNVCPPNGESAQMLFQRAIHFYEELQKQEYSRVAVITHLGVIRMLYAYQNKMDIQTALQEFKLPYGAVFKM